MDLMEDIKEIRGWTFKTKMYGLEYGYHVEEFILAVFGDTLGELFGILDGAEGITPVGVMASMASSGAMAHFEDSKATINGDALGRSVGGFFRRLRAHGGFFKFAKMVLKNTTFINAEMKSVPIPYALMIGKYAMLEEVVYWALMFNFREYFLERAAQVAAILGIVSEESTEELSEEEQEMDQ